MTPQELSLLEDLTQRLAAVRGVQKDPQADALIRERLAAQPDALYLLVQRTLLLEHALDEARRELARRDATPSDPGGASFLRRGLEPGFGRDTATPDAYAPGRAAQGGAPLQAAAPTQAPGWRERLFGATAPAAASSGGGGSGPGFLGQAATAAAGMAGGMFLFNGIEHLLGGGRGALHGGDGGFLGLGGSGNQPGTTEVVENITQNFNEGNVDGSGNGDGDGIRRMADDVGAGWAGFDDDGSSDDDRFA